MDSWYDSHGSVRGSCSSYSPSKKLTTSNHLRHVESMTRLPSGAGSISHLNAVILGESLASEENDLIFPSVEFSGQALVPSPQKVWTLAFSRLAASSSSCPCLLNPSLWLLWYGREALFVVLVAGMFCFLSEKPNTLDHASVSWQNSPVILIFLSFYCCFFWIVHARVLFWLGLMVGISTWRCTRGQLRIQQDFGLMLHQSSIGKRSGARKCTMRTSMFGMEQSRLRCVLVAALRVFPLPWLWFCFFYCYNLSEVLLTFQTRYWNSGSRVESPTFATIAWTETWKLDLGTKLPSTGKAMSLSLMES